MNKKVKLPKIGLVNIREYRNLSQIKGKIINATIEKEVTNKYYVGIIIKEI
ncbi:MAG: hypothetical protein Q4E39_05465 [bacterium]|nr:hypothetical protein [bacterium]